MRAGPAKGVPAWLRLVAVLYLASLAFGLVGAVALIDGTDLF